MKYCPNCGAQLSDSAKFCPHCGKPVPATAAPREPAAEPVQDRPAAATPSTPPATPSNPPAATPTATPAAAQPEPPRPANAKKRWGIAAQFDAIAAGQKPRSSYLTYFYGFFQLLYHKSYRLFNRTYLPCCLAFCLDLGLLAYSSTAPNDILSGISAVFLLVIAIWIVVVSAWLSRYYPKELYKQVGGDADRIPNSILPPIIGGIVLLFLAVASLFIGFLLAPVGPSSTSPTESVATSEPAEEAPPEESFLTKNPMPTEAPTAQSPVASTVQESIADVRSVEDCCLVTEQEPWKGAWAYSDGSDTFIFENTMTFERDNVVTNADGSITIYRTDSRNGSIDSIFTLSPDQTTLTKQDAEGNLVQTYVRPTYDMAATPLPTACWGSYTLVEDNTINELNPSGLSNFYGPNQNFIIDAFRIGKAPYNQLVGYSDDIWSAYFIVPPEGGFSNFGFVTEGEDLYFEIYDDSGNVRGRYLRTAR
ncbi:MAG: hypothetical protein DBX91_09105 [Subdoligranulum variabile]|nr:MAG: hypothetical protein DBX91_09105 [Subdoligranulum variabile]